MTEVAASLWSVPPDEQRTTARRLAASGVRRFHWDSSDGTMGPAGGFDPQAARTLMPSGCVAHAHLMMRNPRPSIAAWADFCQMIAVHVSQPHWRQAANQIAALETTPVFAVTSATELALVEPEHAVLIMSIAPGHAGSTFDEGTFEVVRQAARKGHPWIGVDGSVTTERAVELVAAGATSIVSGTALLRAERAEHWLAAIP